MPTYDIKQYSPQFGGVINSSGELAYPVDAIDATGNYKISPQLYNSTSYDAQRGNQSFTGLASAARTATVTTQDFTNHNARGILVYLNITAAPASPASGGLRVQVFAKSKNGQVYALNTAPTTVNSVIARIYGWYAGAGTSSFNFAQMNGGVMPRTFYIQVEHLDAQSYTYALDFDLVM